METEIKPIQPDLPRFARETAFYQAHLRIDPQTGRKFLRLGLFRPDALTGSGHPLFRIDSRSISKIKTAIRRYQRKHTRHNVR